MKNFLEKLLSLFMSSRFDLYITIPVLFLLWLCGFSGEFMVEYTNGLIYLGLSFFFLIILISTIAIKYKSDITVQHPKLLELNKYKEIQSYSNWVFIVTIIPYTLSKIFFVFSWVPVVIEMGILLAFAFLCLFDFLRLLIVSKIYFNINKKLINHESN